MLEILQLINVYVWNILGVIIGVPIVISMLITAVFSILSLIIYLLDGVFSHGKN